MSGGHDSCQSSPFIQFDFQQWLRRSVKNPQQVTLAIHVIFTHLFNGMRNGPKVEGMICRNAYTKRTRCNRDKICYFSIMFRILIHALYSFLSVWQSLVYIFPFISIRIPCLLAVETKRVSFHLAPLLSSYLLLFFLFLLFPFR